MNHIHFLKFVSLSIVLVPGLFAQSEQQLASYFKKNPGADANGDGVLTRQEARDHRQGNARRNDPSRGDNLSSVSEIKGIDIPLSKAPLKEVKLKSADGVDLSFAYRKPQGEGTFPTIVFLHGGGGQSNLEGLKKNLLNGAIQTRFLEKGYVTVQSTRRPYWVSKDKAQLTGFWEAVADAAMVVEKVKTLPGVDPDRIILYGGSGGGILAITTASKTEVACVVAGEPATVVPLDPRTGKSAGPAEYRNVMENPKDFYTAARQKETRAWMKEIHAPVLILQGNQTGLYKTNFEILIPEMKALGKDISYIEFPGKSHGFYWGTTKTGATLETVEKIILDVTGFIERHTQ